MLRIVSKELFVLLSVSSKLQTLPASSGHDRDGLTWGGVVINVCSGVKCLHLDFKPLGEAEILV